VFYAFTMGLAHFCIGPKAFVEAHFPRAELTQAMGGWATFTRGDETWLGVWGARKTSRFRRILRERGAVFTLERKLPRGIRRGVWVTR
jgi:hypothetical protein